MRNKNTHAIPTSHYMLRRGLLLSKWKEIVFETVHFCLSSKIDEIIWKCDAEAFNHGITPLHIVRQYIDVLSVIREELQTKGIMQSVNPWITLNWEDRGRDQRDLYPNWRWRVDIDGKKANACPCLRCEQWREHITHTYGLYAKTKPNILWLEDDFKTFMNGGGCFCEDCIEEFSKRLGKNLDRESLIEHIFRPGKPDELRKQWIDFLGKEMIITCARIEKAVHQESPCTHLGMMASWSSDSRWWHEAARTLAGDLQPVARPSLASYKEARAIEFIPDRFDIVKETIAYGKDVRICPELENHPYTSFSKSSRMTRLQLCLSQILGHKDITINIFDMVGTSIGGQTRIGEMLNKSKEFFNALAHVCRSEGKAKGVGMIWNPRLADYMPLNQGEGIDAFQSDGEGWSLSLQGAGLPVVWDDSPVIAATGRILYALDDSQIKKRLSGGILLDGSAAHVLCQRGYAEYLGILPVDSFALNHRALSAEEFFNEDFGGHQGCYMDIRGYGNHDMKIFNLQLMGAQEISRFVDPDQRPIMPAMTTYENSLGGRVVVHSFDMSTPCDLGFMNWTRKKQLMNVVRWLGRGRLELFVEGGAWMVPIRRDYPDYTFIGLLNFETDDWEEVVITLSWDNQMLPKQIKIASNNNGWLDIKPQTIHLQNGHLRIQLGEGLSALDCLALMIMRT